MKEAKAVTLVRYVKTKAGWRYLDAAIADNGRVLANKVIVKVKITPGLQFQILDGDHRKGKQKSKAEVFVKATIEGRGEITGVLKGTGKWRYIEMVEEHEEGCYKLRSYQGKKTVYKDVEGNDPVEAKKELDSAIAKSNLIASGNIADVDVTSLLPGSVSLETYWKKLIQDKIDEKKIEMFKVVTRECGEFLFGIEGSKTWTGLRKGITPEEITIDHFKKYTLALSDNGSTKRTVENKFAAVKHLLAYTDVVMPKKMRDYHPPRSEEKLPEYYTKAERDKFLAACETPRERIISNIAMKTGLREQELMFIEETEFDFEAMTVTVHSKNDEGFLIKDKAERRIPLDADLARDVQAYIKANPEIRWITGTAAGAPDHNLLKMVKRVGKRAELKCRVFLHKFRATYATTLLRNHVDIRTVQTLMGHEDIATTMKYLRAIEAEDEGLQKKVNEIVW
jgi:integrase